MIIILCDIRDEDVDGHLCLWSVMIKIERQRC